MIQINILSGKKAGGQSVVRRFPLRVGRAPGNELQLDDDGVWDRHLTLEFGRDRSFTLEAAPDALVAVNNQPVQTAALRNGDVITLGSAKLQFWFTAAAQRGLTLRESMVWALLIGVTLGQCALIYRLCFSG